MASVLTRGSTRCLVLRRTSCWGQAGVFGYDEAAALRHIELHVIGEAREIERGQWEKEESAHEMALLEGRWWLREDSSGSFR